MRKVVIDETEISSTEMGVWSHGAGSCSGAKTGRGVVHMELVEACKNRRMFTQARSICWRNENCHVHIRKTPSHILPKPVTPIMSAVKDSSMNGGSWTAYSISLRTVFPPKLQKLHVSRQSLHCHLGLQLRQFCLLVLLLQMHCPLDFN